MFDHRIRTPPPLFFFLVAAILMISGWSPNPHVNSLRTILVLTDPQNDSSFSRACTVNCESTELFECALKKAAFSRKLRDKMFSGTGVLGLEQAFALVGAMSVWMVAPHIAYHSLHSRPPYRLGPGGNATLGPLCSLSSIGVWLTPSSPQCIKILAAAGIGLSFHLMASSAAAVCNQAPPRVAFVGFLLIAGMADACGLFPLLLYDRALQDLNYGSRLRATVIRQTATATLVAIVLGAGVIAGTSLEGDGIDGKSEKMMIDRPDSGGAEPLTSLSDEETGNECEPRAIFQRFEGRHGSVCILEELPLVPEQESLKRIGTGDGLATEPSHLYLRLFNAFATTHTLFRLSLAPAPALFRGTRLIGNMLDLIDIILPICWIPSIMALGLWLAFPCVSKRMVFNPKDPFASDTLLTIHSRLLCCSFIASSLVQLCELESRPLNIFVFVVFLISRPASFGPLHIATTYLKDWSGSHPPYKSDLVIAASHFMAMPFYLRFVAARSKIPAGLGICLGIGALLADLVGRPV